MNNIESVKAILSCLGGEDNVVFAQNCMTRLRVQVRDEEKVDADLLEDRKEVLGLVHDRPCYYEIVVGPGKSRKFADICYDMGISGTDPSGNVYDKNDWRKNKAALKKEQRENKIKDILKTVGEIFIPMIPGIMTAGLCAGFAALIAQLCPDYQEIRGWNAVYMLLTLISTSFNTYITAWVGYRAAERFGATPILGGMLGMITSLDGINAISKIFGMFNDSEPLLSILRAGKGGVLAVIVGVFVLSRVERTIREHMPESVDIIFTPVLSLLIVAVPYILLIMPALGYVASGIVWVFGKACLSDNAVVSVLTGYIASAVFLPMVASGMHHGMVALYSVQLQELGYVTLFPALAMAGAGQVGAAIAIMRMAKKTGDKRLVSVIEGSLPAGFLGIGEPLIYGVTLPMGKPFITAGLGAGFGGAFVTLMKVAATTWGPSGLLAAFIMTAGKGGPLFSMLMYLAGLLISYIMSFIITNAMLNADDLKQKRKKAMQGNVVRHGDVISIAEQAAESDNENDTKAETKPDQLREEMALQDHISHSGEETAHNTDNISFGVSAFADGKLIAMRDIPDPVFSSGTMGRCVGIVPENDEIYSPCDGTITMITETKHALSIKSDDGREFLVHAGIDTVKLAGNGFQIPVREGEKVKCGQHIMSMDRDIVRQAGCAATVILVMIEE